MKTVYSYWGIDHEADSYGRLWEIKTLPQAGGTALQDAQYTWDPVGNLSQRCNLVTSETEDFSYDFLDRLTGVSGAYSESYSYNSIGNLTSKGGNSYTYGDSAHKHAVTQVGSTSYAYDANGNMTTRGGQAITWDVENKPIAIAGGASFVYDGDGNRVKKTEGGQTILYVNQYYEKNLTTGVATTYYYLGGKLIFKRTPTTQEYVHQDSLGSTVLTTDTQGGVVGSLTSYYPFGAYRAGLLPDIDIMFTGQRNDGGGLYYYGARYYDVGIGRFLSADTVVQSYANPQTLNRYSYCVNNPLKYTDPGGNYVVFTGGFSYRSPQNRQVLEQAWKMLQWAAADVPQLAEVMKKVEESDSLVKIGWTPIASGTGSVVIGDDRFGRQSVYMDSTLLDDDIRIVAHNLAHELYHAAEGRQADSIQEEMEAYRMQYDVAAKLCLPLKNTGLEQIHRLDPSAPKGLEAGESILRAWGAVYPWIPMYPIPVSDPFFESFQFASYYVYYDLNGQRKP